MSLVHDIAASEPADVAEVIQKLRHALVEMLEESAANRAAGHPGGHPGGQYSVASKRAHQIVCDLDAGELLWPGWKKARA